MLKLEDKVKKLIRNTVLAGSLFFGASFAQEAYSQNIVSGTITSVPLNTPVAQTRITFTNTSNGNKYSQLTNDGVFSINLPTGTYERKIEGIGNYQVLDTLTINSSQVLNEKIIDVEPVTSTVYGPSGQNRSLLYLLKLLTNSDGVAGNTLLYRVTNQNPWRLYARNYSVSDPESMPLGLRTYFDEAITEIITKIPEITFNEQTTENLVEGITFRYPTTSGMPGAGLAITYADENNALVYINRDNIMAGTLQKEAITREIFARSAGLYTLSTDISFVTYTSGQGSGVIHPDEVNVARRMLNLTYLTDMSKYKDISITTVPDTFFSSISASTPDNGLTFNNDRIGQRDPDGDTVNEQVWNFKKSDNTPYNSITNSSNNSVNVAQSYFSQHTQYKANVTLKQKYNNGVVAQSLASSDMTFTTPNIEPTLSGNVTNNQMIAWTPSNNFIFLQDAADPGEPNTLVEKVELYKGAIKQKEANGESLTVLKSEVVGNTLDYFVRFIVNDGIVNKTLDVPIRFPDNPTTIDLKHNNVSIANNTNIVFASGIYTVDLSAIDPDGAVSGPGIRLKTPSGTIISQVNGTTMNIAAPVVKGNKTLEGIATENSVTTSYTRNVIFPNNLPDGTADLTNGQTIPAWNAQDKYRVNFTSSDFDSDPTTISSKIKQGASTLQTATGTFIDINKIAKGTYTLEYTINDGTGNTIKTQTFNTPNNIPTQTIVSPLNNSTPVYDGSNRIEVDTNPDNAQDFDGENLNKRVVVRKKSDNSLIKDITQANNLAFYVLKSEVQPNTEYTITTTLTDGSVTTSPLVINITTPTETVPNIPPTTPTIVSPANNSFPLYDGLNRIEIDTNPDALLDGDGDSVNKIVELWNENQTTKLFEKTQANNTQVYFNKGTELQAHTKYVAKAKATDGKETTPYSNSVAFTTPNFLSAFNIVSPSGGQVINYNINKEIDIVTIPAGLKDEDNDTQIKNLRIYGPGLDTLISKPNDTRIYLKESRLQPNSTYTIEGSLADGYGTTPTVSTTFKTPVIVGVEPVFDGLKVYPNPFNRDLRIEYNKDLDVRIIDMQGREVYNQKINSTDVIQPELINGMYILQLNDGKNKYVQKIIKKD